MFLSVHNYPTHLEYDLKGQIYLLIGTPIFLFEHKELRSVPKVESFYIAFCVYYMKEISFNTLWQATRNTSLK